MSSAPFSATWSRRGRKTPSESLIAQYRAVQNAAKMALIQVADQIDVLDTEASIAEKARRALASQGVTKTWYHNCPALVLLGTRSCLSIPGNDYEPALERVGRHNLVTVDLSPMKDGCWGDYARSIFVENGQVTQTPKSSEFSDGMEFLSLLHAAMRRVARPEMTLHELFEWTESKIKAAGFENLDFAGNVGHSIGLPQEPWRLIERGNLSRLGEVPFFTFEPHVRSIGGHWGLKHENIVFFNEAGKIEEL